MTSLKNEFLTKGLSIYPRAYSTMAGFKGELNRNLCEILDQYDKWPPGFDKKGKATGSGAITQFLYAKLKGRLGKYALEIYLGYSCAPRPDSSEPWVLYAEYKLDGQMIRLEDKTLVTSALRAYGNHIYVAPSDPPDLTLDCVPLLNELAAQLAKLSNRTHE